MKSSTFFFSVIQKCLFVGFLSLFLFLPKQALTQLNVDSLSHINYQQLHAANLNDVWGYVDEMGNEYALVGTSKGTSIVNVTDPTNPVEVFWSAPESLQPIQWLFCQCPLRLPSHEQAESLRLSPPDASTMRVTNTAASTRIAHELIERVRRSGARFFLYYSACPRGVQRCCTRFEKRPWMTAGGENSDLSRFLNVNDLQVSNYIEWYRPRSYNLRPTIAIVHD